MTIELTFWNNRLRNFTQIYKQLRNEQIRSMAMILEATDSAYFPCFSTTFKNVVTGNQDKDPNENMKNNHPLNLRQSHSDSNAMSERVSE